MKVLLVLGILIIGWEEIHHFSNEKEKKSIQIIEKNVIEDNASSLKAIKLIFFQRLETSKIREPEGAWLTQLVQPAILDLGV